METSLEGGPHGRAEQAQKSRAAVDVSIILCTLNRRRQLTDSLADIARLSIPEGWAAELVLVDNGSSDGTRELASSAVLPNMPLRYVFEPRKGKGYAYNAGLGAASGEVFLLTDDDTRVPRDWVEAMCRPILERRVAAVQGGIRIAAHLERPWLKGVLRTWVAEVTDPVHAPAGLVGANMAFSREALGVGGPFDVRLGPGAAGFFDDTVFGWALQAAGQKILYLPSVAVEHHFDPDRLSLQAFMSSARRMASSRALVFRDGDPLLPNRSWSALLRGLPALAFRATTQLGRYAIGREPDAGFLYHYYRFCLWRAYRRSQAAD